MRRCQTITATIQALALLIISFLLARPCWAQWSLEFLLVLVSGTSLGGWSGNVSAGAEPKYTIAFASFGPRNTDLFVADADGKNPKPLVPHADNDYNASFSPDGRWIVFSSHRNGHADLYRVHPDGTGQERLTDDPAFDDQAATTAFS